ncbi:MAG: cell division topological specificity factor MinE [Lachnospiraceae bacterium]|nr:cell division topological specificity factor MinE [Lachnospiraceae bacterium]
MWKIFHKKSSGNVAKDRLKILLISDRVNCSPEMMELIKNEIIQVLSKYMKIDSEKMEINITKKNSKGRNAIAPSLYANIPIIDLKK